MTQLNSDLLRTFLAITEAGSVTGGAERINRSQSATSLQVRQLEEIIGKPLFARHGRGVELTKAGETLRPVARQVVQSLDRSLRELRGEGLAGHLTIGMPEQHGRETLTQIISEFSTLHPKVELEVFCARGLGFETALASEGMDIAVFEVAEPKAHQTVLRHDALIWVAGSNLTFVEDQPLPVALFDRTCWWRDLALKSLEAAKLNFKIVFTSENAVGVQAAVRSGMAAGLLHASDDLSGLRLVPGLEEKLPSFLVLQTASDNLEPAGRAMSNAIQRAFTIVE